MGWARVVLILITIQAFFPPRALVFGDFLSPLSPLLSPVLNGICNTVECGKGSCEVSLNQTFGFICKCNSGWTQFHVGDHFSFLPCIIPNCSINYSCSNNSGSPAPAPAAPPPTNLFLFDPCMWAFCGGGKCSAASAYEHKCECNEGYSNLFNRTAFPCIQDCSIGADCNNLGLNISNSTSSAVSPPNLPYNGKSHGGDPLAPKNSLRLSVLVILLAISQMF